MNMSDLFCIIANGMNIMYCCLELSINSLCKHPSLQNQIYNQIYKLCDGNINNIKKINISNISILKAFIYNNLILYSLPTYRYDSDAWFNKNNEFIVLILSLFIFKYKFQFKNDNINNIVITERIYDQSSNSNYKQYQSIKQVIKPQKGLKSPNKTKQSLQKNNTENKYKLIKHSN
eukprot:82933_1